MKINKTLTNITHYVSLFQRNNTRYLFLFTAIYIYLFARFLWGYFAFDFIIGAILTAFIYVISPGISKYFSYKYLFFSSLFLILTFLSGVKTFYFLTIGFALLFVTESLVGSLGILPIFLLCLLSPVFKYFNNMLGFPVRLKLSEWTGFILQNIGYKNEVAGNIIILNGTEYSVDPACVGLKMIAFSLLAGLLIMAYFEKTTKKTFSFQISAGILFIIIVLNIFANLIRIVMLTIFKILPDNPFHEILGTICFLLYVIIPSYFIIKWINHKINGKVFKSKTGTPDLKRILLINLLLVGSICGIGLWRFNNHQDASAKLSPISLQGYSKTIVGEDVLKFEKPGLLVYIKPLARFYGAEHNPMICWVGSGYQFSRINKEIIEGKEIYTGTLKKGNDLIYSAWWFDSGEYQTINQIDWRWRALKGELFSLVNVNSDNPKMLKPEIRNLLIERMKFTASTKDLH